MDIKVTHLDRIYSLLSEKTGKPLDHTGFNEMEEALGIPIARYLSDNFRKLSEAKKKGELFLNLKTGKLDEIANSLGKSSIYALINSIESPISPKLQKLVGKYWSVVRCNSGAEDLLISPVEITEKENKIFMQLFSPSRIFEGELQLQGDCLLCLLNSRDMQKQLHFVFKLGIANNPNIMQGVYSGINTAQFPIAGRELLIKSEKLPLDDWSHSKVSFEELRTNLRWNKNLLTYFSEYTQNNLKVSKVATFDWNDLIM